MDDSHHTDPAPRGPVQRLLRVMAALRGPSGCPWDKAQTHRSLLPFIVEEAYELVEAVETGSDDDLREELGDVLLQVVFHAQLAAERGAFAFGDVAAVLADKLEARHPHVFGGEALETPAAVSDAWHARKMEARRSALDGVPTALPALQRAQQAGGRAARAGFEWHDTGEILAKAAEELGEFREAVQDEGAGADAVEAEFGDLLFSLVQLARWQGVDAEAALRRATRKFGARFRWMEDALRARGLQAEQEREPREARAGGTRQESPSAGQWWALWEEAKRHTS